MTRFVLWCFIITLGFKPSSSSARKTIHEYESNTHSVNLTNLIHRYVLICGHGYICDDRKFDFPYKSDLSYRKSSCPDCQCDRKCIIRGDCCPDVIFAYSSYECTSTTVLGNSNNGSSMSNMMVERCPTKATATDQEKCTKNYTSDELIQTIPVTSSKYVVTFKNKYCAECNNVTNYRPWSLDFKCLQFADFNFVSSFTEMANLAREKDCSIEYVSTNENMQLCNDTSNNESRSKNIIGNCNVTGHWLHYDRDIAHACRSNYYLKYEFYKNVFCSICNPPRIFKGRKMISSCTHKVNPEEKVLERSCNKYGYIASAYPFKNIFCRLCNVNPDQMDQFKDANATVTRSVSQGENKEFNYRIQIYNFNTDFFGNVVDLHDLLSYANSSLDELQDIKHSILSKTDTRFSSKDLILNDYSLKGIYSYCVGNWTPYVFLPDDCSCNLSCFFALDQQCCLDLLLTAPISCYPDDRTGNRNKINESQFMVDGCFKSSVADSLRQQCENASDYGIFEIIPVFDKSKKIVYKNFACYLCNQDFQTMDDLFKHDAIDYNPWTVHLSCISDINVHLHVLLSDVLFSAKEVGCSIIIKPDADETSVIPGMNKGICTDNIPYINRCNTTGLWEKFDSDVAYGCEESSLFLPTYLQYKNVFCFMCNPKEIKKFKALIDSCNTPANNLVYRKNIIEACRDLPYIQTMYPYKNIFCEYCKMNETFTILPKRGFSREHCRFVVTQEEIDIDIPVVMVPVLHDIFSRKKSESTEEVAVVIKHVQVTNTPVTHAWVYDQVAEKNRNLSCYPGKWLIGEKCIPLLPITNHLRYTLTFAITGGIIHPFSLLKWMDILKQSYKLHIIEILNATDIQFDSFYLISNLTCDANTTESSRFLKVFLHTIFLVKDDVERLTTEEILNNLTQSIVPLQNFTGSVHPDIKAFHAPVLIHDNEFANHCHIMESTNYSFDSDKDYRSSFVSNLLLCRQIELEKSEYDIDNSTQKLRLKWKEYTFPFNKYHLTWNGKARICLEDFEFAMRKEIKTNQITLISIALGITNFICTIISMISLTVTFITYCLFRPLRSVPGKNNMSLIFAMFFAQGLFQFGSGQTSNKIACRVIGVLSHFFWLSTFGCMGICSYHMFSVFSRSVTSRRIDRKDTHTILFYNLVSYGSSVIVVTVSVVVGITTMEGDFFGYGDDFCFLTCVVSLTWAFLIPVMLICVLNIYFFIISAFRIKSSPTVNSNQESKKNYAIYIKLFSVTGIAWLLLIIDSFVHKLTVFSFLVTILNGCQGLYIFISFCWNKRVASLYRNFYKSTRKDSMKMSFSTSTKSSSSNL